MQSGTNQFKNNTIFGLEDKLSRMLKPVSPDPVFLDTLKTKLSHTPSIIIEKSKKGIGFLVLGLGLFTGALTLWIVGRAKKLKKITH